MSWHETHTQELDEPDEDKALRDELRALMGIDPKKCIFESRPTPELTRLADELRKEAARRKRIPRLAAAPRVPKSRHISLLAAAVIPFFLAVGGLGYWGMQQKRRADEMAVKIQTQLVENQKLMAASQALQKELQTARENMLLKVNKRSNSATPAQPSRHGMELVVPAEEGDPNSPAPNLPSPTLVKGRQSGYK